MQRGEPEKGGETNETVSINADDTGAAVWVLRDGGGKDVRLQGAGRVDGYSYDKFEKMWSLAGEYRIKAADGYISVALIALGDKESVQGVMLTAGVYKSDGSIYGTIDKIEILADDTLISIKMMPLEVFFSCSTFSPHTVVSKSHAQKVIFFLRGIIPTNLFILFQ